MGSHESVVSEAPPELAALGRLSCDSARWNRTERSPRLPPDLCARKSPLKSPS